MISINEASVIFGDKIIFNNLTWSINEGSRIGLVGDNGTGKTTLVKALAGERILDGGTVSIPGYLRIGYLPQDLIELGDKTVMEFIMEKTGMAQLEKELAALETAVANSARGSGKYKKTLARLEEKRKNFEAAEGYSFDAMARKVLKGLGFMDDDPERMCGEFSGGWKMRILLASVLLSKPDLLLLDEPTNHLDTESMEWLESWLSSYSGTIVAVSHDKIFLDKVCRQIAELSNGDIVIYKGNYSEYMDQKVKNREILEKARKKQQKEMEKTEAFISRFRYKASKASQVQSRIRKLEKIRTIEAAEQNRSIHLRFPPCRRSGYEVAKLEGAAQSYGDKSVFSNVDLTIHRGEKIALVGVNGAGKSTLSRLIGRIEPPSKGTVTNGHMVKTGFFSQESARNLDYHNSIWQEISGIGPLSEQEKKNLLGAFLFSGDDIQKRIAVLSGGEKSRLALLKLLLEDFNFLILDEPTNHLDMKTRELFQQALIAYDGTLVIVSHDRYFLDKLVNRVIEVHEGHITDYPGNYSYFIEKRSAKTTEDNKPESSPKGNEYVPSDQRVKKRVEAERRNRLSRAKKHVLSKLEPVEERIATLETEKNDLDRKLCDGDLLRDSRKVQEIMKRRSEIAQDLGKLMPQWENLMKELEDATQNI